MTANGRGASFGDDTNVLKFACCYFYELYEYAQHTLTTRFIFLFKYICHMALCKCKVCDMLI